MAHSFKKVMSATDILVVAFGAMIGWGWVVSSGGWIQNAGVVGTVIGFIIGGIMIYFVGLTYAELTPAMPKVGGEHVFSYKAFGGTGSFVCTWALILSYIGVVCFEAVSLPTIVFYIFPSFAKGYMYSIAGSDVYLSGVIIAAVCTIGIIVVNIIGIKAASILQTVLTVTIAGVGIILVVASAINGSASNLENQVIIGEGFDSVKNIMAVVVVAPFFLFGFDVIPQVAEEINIPLKKIARVLLLSIICAVAFYGLVVFAVGFALNTDGIKEAMTGSGLVKGDYKGLGKLMKISHDGDRVTGKFPMKITDEYLIKCSEEEADIAVQPGAYGCSVPEIDALCDMLNSTDGVLGSQMLGAGLGGCIAVLVEKNKADGVLQKLKENYYDKHGFPLLADVYLPESGSSVEF